MPMSGFRIPRHLKSECGHSQLGICRRASSFFNQGRTILLSPQRPRNVTTYTFNHNYHDDNYTTFTSKRLKLLSTTKASYCSCSIANANNEDTGGLSFVHNCCASQHSTSSSPIVSDSLSPAEHGIDPYPYEGLSAVAGGVVALGKFDALHIGHRELAIQAAKIGVPFLMSFVGMAAVFGWEPKAPIVAECDRKRVLSSWTPLCGNVTPKEVQIDFSKVRYLTPEQFVDKLTSELGVRGVIAGQNYRFGYKASGDASDLVRLCNDYGMRVCIINSIMDKNQDPKSKVPINSKDQGQVSSTRVRQALSNGDMTYASELLGRHHRLILMVKNQKRILESVKRLSYPRSCLLNLAPKEGRYENCSLVIEGENAIPCGVVIDEMDIHLELDELTLDMVDICKGSLELLGVEFGHST